MSRTTAAPTADRTTAAPSPVRLAQELERKLVQKPKRRIVLPLPDAPRSVTVNGWPATHAEVLALIPKVGASVKVGEDVLNDDGSTLKAPTGKMEGESGAQLYAAYVDAMAPARKS